jgi:hypothetical protein
MATGEWTDGRLTDAFDALRRDIADLGSEMRAMRVELRETRAELHAEMHAGFRALWLALVGSYVSLLVAVVGAVLAIEL